MPTEVPGPGPKAGLTGQPGCPHQIGIVSIGIGNWDRQYLQTLDFHMQGLANTPKTHDYIVDFLQDDGWIVNASSILKFEYKGEGYATLSAGHSRPGVAAGEENQKKS